MPLVPCSDLWGAADLRAELPGSRAFADVTYLPFVLDTSWGLYDEAGRIIEESVDFRGPERFTNSQSLEPPSGYAEPVEMPEGAYLYLGRIHLHYGHFIVNSLPRFWPLLDWQGELPTLVCHGPQPKERWSDFTFLAQMLDALGIGLERLHVFDRPVRFRRIEVPSTSLHEQRSVHEVFGRLCRKIGAHYLAAEPEPACETPLYLSKTRLRSGVGCFENEQVIEGTLRAAGVDVAYPESLSFPEQVRLLSRRRLLVGTTGSSFHTSVFCPEGRKIVGLNPSAGINSNFVLLDLVSANDASYVLAEGTTNSHPGGSFLTVTHLASPADTAEDLLDLIECSSDWRRKATGRAVPRDNGGRLSASARSGKEKATAMSLFGYFLDNQGAQLHKSGHYFFAYERHFGKYVGKPLTFLEISVGNGGSSQMWKRWFGPLARIVTVDVNPASQQVEDEQVAVRIGDPSDPRFLQSVLDEFGTPDAVLDDGSHRMDHVAATFDYLYPRIASTGVYMIEDMHTAYWPEYGGGLGSQTSIVERFKSLVDALHADHVRDDRSGLPTDFARSTVALTAYDSVLVFERAPYINRVMRMTGGA